MTRLDRHASPNGILPSNDRNAERGAAPGAIVPAAANAGARRVGGVRGDGALAPAPVRASAAAPVPVMPTDLQQAAYILARDVMGRPLPPTHQAVLWQGNETRKAVLDMLPHGRGNVVTDVQATNRVSYQRTFAARAIVEGWPRRGSFDPEVAALTTLAGSGNCSEMVNLAAHVHAPRLEPGDRLLAQQVGFIDHTWLRVQCATPDGGAPGSGHAAIIDPWAEGPVADPGDTRLPSGSVGDVSSTHRLDRGEARSSGHAFELARADVEERHGDLLERNVRRGVDGWHILSDPEPLLDGRFAYHAREAVDAVGPVAARAGAVAVLQSAPAGFSASQAEENADAVVAWARDLRRAHPRNVSASRPSISPDAARPDADAT